jgi:hypothetical protein
LTADDLELGEIELRAEGAELVDALAAGTHDFVKERRSERRITAAARDERTRGEHFIGDGNGVEVTRSGIGGVERGGGLDEAAFAREADRTARVDDRGQLAGLEADRHRLAGAVRAGERGAHRGDAALIFVEARGCEVDARTGEMTGVSDGVLNPYTATLTPNTIIPVASNDTGNPSLTTLDVGGNYQNADAQIEQKRQSVRRTMLGPEPSEGAVKSATEIDINDRNRLWAMNGEFNRIQAELLAKVVSRGVHILQKLGLIPKFKVNGREVNVKYTSPFAKTQNAEDVMALQEALVIAGSVGPELMNASIKMEEIPGYVFRLKGLPEKLIRNDQEREDVVKKGAEVLAVAQQAEQAAAAGTAAPPPASEAGQ